tara:strand:- start:304 stop:639 length:336 start_codon:yes stop_codon:yes gene_type:complete
MTVTKELLENTCKAFPNLPAHVVKMMFDFDETNPTYLQDNPEIMNKSFSPESFTKVLEHSVGVKKAHEVEDAPVLEGMSLQPITKLSEEEYEKQLELMKAEDRKQEMAEQE